MNVQVNRNQMERVVIKWLNKRLGNLTPKKHKDFPDVVFYVDSSNNVILQNDKLNEHVYIHYGDIWPHLEKIFHIGHNDVKSIIKVWLEDTYKLKGVRPIVNSKASIFSWEELTN
jgi:hypothetical protein